MKLPPQRKNQFTHGLSYEHQHKEKGHKPTVMKSDSFIILRSLTLVTSATSKNLPSMITLFSCCHSPDHLKQMTIPLIWIHVWGSQSCLLAQRYTPEPKAPLVCRVSSASLPPAEGWTPAKDQEPKGFWEPKEALQPLTHPTHQVF